MFSDRYEYFLNQTRQFHATHKTFSGRGCLKHWSWIRQIGAEVGAESALDYGCGKGLQYGDVLNDGLTMEQQLGFEVFKYDPGVMDWEARPEGKFDLVWCCDVLEMVPEEDVAAVLTDIGQFVGKAIFFSVASYPAKKKLPDGTNSHVTVESPSWWAEQFDLFKRNHPGIRVEYQIA